MKTLLEIKSADVAGFSKTEISNVVQSIVAPIEEGFQSALETDLQLKAIEEVVKEARERINASVRAEAEELISGGQKELSKVTFEVRKGYATYNYEEDAVYSQIKNQLEERKKLLDQVAKSTGLVIIDEESGEQVPKVGVKSYSKDSIVYKFLK